jgi:hypothetical protein
VEVASQGKISEIASLSLLVLLSPVILLWIIVQVPFSEVRRTTARRREKRFAAEMRAAGRLVTWAEARSQIDNQHGTLIGEFVSNAYRLWWTPEDVPSLSPYPCRFEADKPPEHSDHSLFDEWCRSQFTSPESGTARLVDIRKPDEEEWFYYRAPAGKHVHVEASENQR